MRVPALLTRVVALPAVLAALVLSVLVAAPAQAQVIRPDYWGMHAFHWQSTYAPSVPVGSANLTTSSTYWKDIQVTRRSFSWARLDEQVAAAEAMGAQPMLVLGKTPKFYSARPNSTNYDAYVPPMRPWRAFVNKVVRKYKTRLDYQIWPEPNVRQNWLGTPAQLAKITAAASQIINNVAPRAKVVGPAMTLRLKGQRTFMVQYYKQSVGGKRIHRYLDAIALDTFPEIDGTPEDAYALTNLAKRMLANAGVRRVPFYNNEINYGVQGGGSESSYTLTLDEQQAYVVRTFALSAAARMARTYWLGWFETNTMAVDMARYNSDTKSFEALQPAKGYTTVRNWMNGTSFSGCAKSSSGLWTCTMTSGTKTRKIYWRQSGSSTVRRPAGLCRVEDMSGTDISGDILTSSYNVTPHPIMVETGC